jgi:hypothetical protein
MDREAKGRASGDSRLFDNDRAPMYWSLLIGVPCLLAFVVAIFLPMRAPMPAYLHSAQEYAKTGRISDITYPVEFSWMAGLSILTLGARGVEVLQAVLYLAIVVSVWALARGYGASPRSSLIAALVAAIYPQLPVSVAKVWDVELSVLLMVALLLSAVSLMRYGPRWGLVCGSGIVFGLCLAQRSNMFLLFPVLIYACLASTGRWPRKLAALVVAAGLTAATFAGVNVLAHGSFFLPRNGPYNLVQGHNEYSIEVMLRDQTCEPSVGMFMKADGRDPSHIDEIDPALQQYFTQRAFAYMRSHPVREIEITAVKLWTIFRPSTRVHQETGLMTVPIFLMALIFPAWVVVLLRRKMAAGLDRLDLVFIATVALYVLPFLITSSDPRYQIPIEICMLSHIAGMATTASPRTAMRPDERKTSNG